MATPLELTQLYKALEARVSALEAAQKEIARNAAAVTVTNQLIDSVTLTSKPLDQKKVAENTEKTKKLCPHCGEKPAYHFHVKNCPAKNKNKGANGEADRQ